MSIDRELEMILYSTPESDVTVSAIIKDETLWLNQKSLAELFNVDISTINQHLKNIFETQELEQDSTIGKFPIVQTEGKRTVRRTVTFYNLDAIISVGYRVNSKKATAFRKWATSVLNEYIRKGFVMDDDRLKQGTALFGKDYFKELLERVRSIRASERRIWQQITDIFAECSIDYDKNSDVTQKFYATIQNKFHFAITGKTAAEIVYSSADHTKGNMGLTTWKNAPEGRILKQDAKVAKNYLSETEIRRLERAVTGYFDYIEDLIERENTFTMAEFASSVNEFLEFRKYDILKDNGKISRKQAESRASSEYDIFNRTQFIESDFDKQIQKLKSTK